MERDNEEDDLKYKCGDCSETTFNLNLMVAHCLNKHSSGRANGNFNIEIEAVSKENSVGDVPNFKSDDGNMKDVLKDASDDGKITFIDVLEDVSGDSIVAFIDIIEDIPNDAIEDVPDNAKDKSKSVTKDLPVENAPEDDSNDSYFLAKNVLNGHGDNNDALNVRKAKIKDVKKHTSNFAYDEIKDVTKNASYDDNYKDVKDYRDVLAHVSDEYLLKENDFKRDISLVSYMDEIQPISSVLDTNYVSYVSPFSYDVNTADNLQENSDINNINLIESAQSLFNVTNYLTNAELPNDFLNVDFANDVDSKTNVIDIFYVNDFADISGNCFSGVEPSPVNQSNYSELKSTILCNVNDISSFLENSNGENTGFNQNILYDVIDIEPTLEISNSDYVNEILPTPSFSDRNYVNHVIPKQNLFVENANVSSTKPENYVSKINSTQGVSCERYAINNSIMEPGNYANNSGAIRGITDESRVNNRTSKLENYVQNIESTQDLLDGSFGNNITTYPGSYIHKIDSIPSVPGASYETTVNPDSYVYNAETTQIMIDKSHATTTTSNPILNVHNDIPIPDVSDELFVNNLAVNTENDVPKIEQIPSVSGESYVNRATVKTTICTESSYQNTEHCDIKTALNNVNITTKNLGVIDDHNIRVFDGSQLVYETSRKEIDSESSSGTLKVYMGSKLLFEVSKSFMEGQCKSKVNTSHKEVIEPEPQTEEANPRTGSNCELLCETAQNMDNDKSDNITFKTSQEELLNGKQTSTELLSTSQEELLNGKQTSTELLSNQKSPKEIEQESEATNPKAVGNNETLTFEKPQELSEEDPKSEKKMEPNIKSTSNASEVGKTPESICSGQLLIKQRVEEMQTEENILKETFSKSSVKSYKCDVCGASFLTALSFSTHKEPVFSSKPYKCDVCGISLGSLCLLNVHKRSLVKCNVCDKLFQAASCCKSGTKMETRSKTKENRKAPMRDASLACSDCEVTFKSNQHHSSKIEIKKKRTYKSKYKCHYCEEDFVKKYNLDKHMADVHHLTLKSSFKCDFCDESFPKHIELRKHLGSQHGLKPYKCDICGISVTKSTQLKWHKQLHTGEKPFKCEHCGKTFSRKSTLTAHIRSHTKEKPYKCDICDKSFRLTGDLWRHKKIHGGERQYFCEICGKGFTLKHYLNIHMRTHTGEKRFECHLCKKRFAQSGGLKYHLHGHTGEKCHVCHVCGRSFIHRSSLLHHLKNHDNEKE